MGGEFLSLCCCRSPEDLIHPLFVLQTRRRRRKGGGVVERLRGLRGWVGGDDGGMKRRRFRDDGKRRERKWRLAGAGKKRCCLS